MIRDDGIVHRLLEAVVVNVLVLFRQAAWLFGGVTVFVLLNKPLEFHDMHGFAEFATAIGILVWGLFPIVLVKTVIDLSSALRHPSPKPSNGNAE